MKALSYLAVFVALQVVAAKPSKPIEGCLRTATVPGDGTVQGCFDFAAMHHTTFEKLRDWNYDLRGDCANLDVGNKICIEGPANGATVKSLTQKTPSSSGQGSKKAPASSLPPAHPPSSSSPPPPVAGAAPKTPKVAPPPKNPSSATAQPPMPKQAVPGPKPATAASEKNATAKPLPPASPAAQPPQQPVKPNTVHQTIARRSFPARLSSSEAM
ncbi:hypothetical protein BGZ73_002880 [Actinomortierella ambigua]|nr:hypothetical protein BGZ73_002880 [Actinomortierella ambigua]